MSERLLESDYFTVDLKALFGKDEEEPEEATTDDAGKPEENAGEQTGDNAEDTGAGETGNKETKEKKPKAAKIDWAKELERRIAENEALDPETRESEGAIENKFWEDYFADPQWDPDVARIASSIKLFRKDIKALGFDPKRNAILCFFLKNKTAIKNLIKPGLIDSSKYTVLHNALSSPRLVADSEFMRANKYNIIYCPDLYTKHAKDMETYLMLQKGSLSPKASFYSEETQERNIRIFLKVGQKDVTKPTAKLNKLSDIETILKKNGIEVDLGASGGNGAGNGTNGKQGGSKLSRSDLLNIISQLTVKQSQAALQYLGMTTNNKDVLNMMQKGFSVKMPNASEMLEASLVVAQLLKGSRFTAAEAVEIAEKLLEKIKDQA